MKKKYALAVLLLSSTIIAQNNTAFDQGNAYYNEGNFQEAITTYHSVLDNNQHSAELYFNLANAYYKTNQTAPSIYYYEKALQLAPNDKDIQNNLVFAQNMTVDAIEIIPEVGFARIFNGVVNTFSFDTWAILSVLLMITFIVLFLSYYFTYASNRKRVSFLIGFTALFLSIASIAFAYKKYNMELADNPAIVFAEETDIKTDPNLRSETAFQLHEGTKVQVLENYNDDWTKIKLTDGKTGWIPSEDIKLLNIF